MNAVIYCHELIYRIIEEVDDPSDDISLRMQNLKACLLVDKWWSMPVTAQFWGKHAIFSDILSLFENMFDIRNVRCCFRAIFGLLNPQFVDVGYRARLSVHTSHQRDILRWLDHSRKIIGVFKSVHFAGRTNFVSILRKPYSRGQQVPRDSVRRAGPLYACRAPQVHPCKLSAVSGTNRIHTKATVRKVPRTFDASHRCALRRRTAFCLRVRISQAQQSCFFELAEFLG